MLGLCLIYHRHLTDIPPTYHPYTTDMWPILDRDATLTHRSIYQSIVDRHSTDYRPTICQLSANYRPTIDRCVGRVSADCRPTVYRYIGRQSAEATFCTHDRSTRPILIFCMQAVYGIFYLKQKFEKKNIKRKFFLIYLTLNLFGNNLISNR